jgi:TPR repeat protein
VRERVYDAEQCFREAARQQHVDAQHDLAVLLLDKAAASDAQTDASAFQEEAVQWLKRAAFCGHGNAKRTLDRLSARLNSQT